MAEFYELLCCPSSHAPESELSRWLEAHHGFVPIISHQSGKNKKNLLNLNTDLTDPTDNMSPTDMKEMTEVSLMDKNIKNTFRCL